MQDMRSDNVDWKKTFTKDAFERIIIILESTYERANINTCCVQCHLVKLRGAKNATELLRAFEGVFCGT